MTADKDEVIKNPQESTVSGARKDGKPAKDRVYTEEEIRRVKLFMVLRAINLL
ncbi:MAG: hypothetical protein RLZZ347_738 [Candidatus Parcubacteria bacterium]|jgi:hypothetical protein